MQNKKKKKISNKELKKLVDKTKAGPITYHIPRKKKISKNTAYKRGRAFEYRVKKHFEKQGYYVVRKYASKGAEDLIAIKSMILQRIHTTDGQVIPVKTASEVLLIQCKNLKVEKKLDKKEAQRLKDLAKQCGGTPLLASNANHKLNITEVE